MIVQVDEQAREVITQICHSALKGAGIEVLRAVNTIVANMKPIPKAPVQDPPKENDE